MKYKIRLIIISSCSVITDGKYQPTVQDGEKINSSDIRLLTLLFDSIQ
jgi:hypothetical protein